MQPTIVTYLKPSSSQKIVVLNGVTAVGKSTLFKNAFQRPQFKDKFGFSVSHTWQAKVIFQYQLYYLPILFQYFMPICVRDKYIFQLLKNYVCQKQKILRFFLISTYFLDCKQGVVTVFYSVILRVQM
ncbi:Guanylate_kinase [Hexamita inflata]|uniref:Guanylate_kinase n=1 Tax=Hexamita inflata TaxID=28002 RepID=A0ABP1I0J4_9EUKA